MNKKTIQELIADGFFKLFSKTIWLKKFQSNSRQDGAFGRSDDLMNVISINEDIPTDNQEETLLHEVIHLIDANLGLKLTEEQTQGLSVGFYDFLRSNGLMD